MTKRYLIISGVLILILTIGVTFAFLTTSITGTNAAASATAAKIGNVSYTAEGITSSNTKVLPGWSSGTKSVVVNRTASDYPINYTCTLHITDNDFSDMTLSVSGDNVVSAANKKLTSSDVNVVIASGTLPASNSTVTRTTNYTLTFPETGINQNTQQNGDFTATVTCELDNSTMYYNNENQNGTGTQPVITDSTLVEKVLALNPTRLTRTSFDDVLTTTNTGTLYTTTNTEDGSTVYYFAGNALNNWVKFGKCTSSSYNCTVGDDLYWRIIRTNETIEDGGIRLLYAGSGSVAATNAYIKSNVAYNNDSLAYNDIDMSNTSNLLALNLDGLIAAGAIGGPGQMDNPMYAGYMYGTMGSLANNRTNQTHKSNVATEISSWYTATFNNNSDNKTKDASGNLLTNYINTSAIYCNDRSIGSGSYNTESTEFHFGAYTRLETNKTPSYACGANTSGYGHYFEGTPSTADKFTGSTTNSNSQTIGNGLLGVTPAALITADEIVFAGGKFGSNAPAWYYYNAASTPGSSTNNQIWWTISPSSYGGASASVLIFAILGSNVNSTSTEGRLTQSVPGDSDGMCIRPVISLKSNVKWKAGDGSSSSPFEIKLN